MTQRLDDEKIKLIQGAGVALHHGHCAYIIKHRPPVAWFEVFSDGYMSSEGLVGLDDLDAVRKHYPIVLHGLGLSLGATEPLDWDYIKKLKMLADRVKPAWISDHLSWLAAKGHSFHDLFPPPFTEETIEYIVDRIQQVQDYLKQPILVENVSSYFGYRRNLLPEWEFVNSIAERSGCYILLDINNLYVSGMTHRFNPDIYLENIIPERVKQFHMVGLADRPRYLLDSQVAEGVYQPIWQLYEKALKRFGPIPTLIEWDHNVPEFSILQTEAQRVQALMDKITGNEPR